jgi:hypothetical protein
MANVRIGYGAKVSFKIGVASAVQLAEVIGIGLPNPQIGDVKVTHFLSPDRAEEYIPGMKENGEIPLGINFDAGSATDALIVSAMGETSPITVIISVPTFSGVDQEYTFPGVVKGYEKTIVIDDRQSAVITVRVAGAVVQAAAS